MTYFAPIVTAAGLSVPKFADIQQALIDSYQNIYGATTYLGNDSADYQWISAVALKLFDNMSLCQLAYNNRSPLTAIGLGLDAIVKINGIARLAPNYSTVTLLINGTPGTQIVNGVVQDTNGIQWSMPTLVIIGSAGTVNIMATCNQAGQISAQPNTVIFIVNGVTAGWTSVTNPAAANVGTLPETDSRLRARQSVSVAGPSSSRLAGTQADIEALPNVQRVSVIENQTSVTDSLGNASHSLTCIVENGDPLQIATAIYNNKGIGANTLGTNPAASIITDPSDGLQGMKVTDPNTGNITRIGFVRPTYVPIYVQLTIHGLTSNYNAVMQANIQTAVATYLGDLQIGEEVTQSALYGAALSVMADLTMPDFSIKGLYLGTTAPPPQPSSTNDILMNFYQVAQSQTSYVNITSV